MTQIVQSSEVNSVLESVDHTREQAAILLADLKKQWSRLSEQEQDEVRFQLIALSGSTPRKD